MKLQKDNLNILWSFLIIDELIRNGIDYFCISPGSRSTPLTTAIARHPKARHIICYDERAAAYHAIGYARSAEKPAVVISTSGTAVANYLPGVVEASFDLIPLIILSADRPPELRATGANQTIQQPNIFGDYVRWQFDLPCPNEKIPVKFVLTTVDQAIYRSCTNPAGPVHLNCPFREPLAPRKESIAAQYLEDLKTWNNNRQPYTVYEEKITSIQPENIKDICNKINHAKRGLIILGQLRTTEERMALMSLTKVISWPVFPDILSGLKLGNKGENFIPYYDQYLLSGKFIKSFKPDTILQLGGQITSKRLLLYLEKYAPENYILVTNHPFRFDPIHRVRFRLESNLKNFCETIIPNLKVSKNIDWINLLSNKLDILDTKIESLIIQNSKINEPSISRLITKNIPDNFTLFLANSLSVREMDMYAFSRGALVPLASNRGASGIDGTIASASGYAIGGNKPVILLIGDLAFLHDLNSLSLLKSINHQIIIIVLNNRGGGIFSFLPIAEYDDIFEKYFATPHQFNFEYAAKLFQLPYRSPSTQAEFVDSFLQVLHDGLSTIIEVQTRRDENFKFHKNLQQIIVSELESE
jgi:2-succinyl-5-enolpyruvyl-6-hydroxy-3-cyclohexene-1-carboxylate synthase